MSIAQGTLHYDYPQVQLTDRPTFADFNPAFADIDAKLYSLITDSSTLDGRVDTLESSMVTAQNDIAGLRTDVNTANAGVATNAENITALQVTVGGHTATLKTKLDSIAIADAYDSEHGTYSVGDIVTYNGQRYKCITAVTAAEPFDADKWQGEDIQTVLDDINSDLADVVKTELIATSNANQTYAVQLTELFTAYSALSAAQKMHTKLVTGSLTNDIVNQLDGVFTSEYTGSSELLINQFDLRNSVYLQGSVTTSGYSRTNKSTDTNTNAMYLYVS